MHTLVELNIRHVELLLPASAQQPCCEALLKQSALLLQAAAEAKAYIQYVAYKLAMDHHVPVLLTDGNIMVLYIHDIRLNSHQRIYWGFGHIVDASTYLAELLKEIAFTNPVLPGYDPREDNKPRSPEDRGTDHDEREHDVKHAPMTTAEQHQGSTTTARSVPLGQQHCLTEMQDADMQEALRLARFHPCVTAVCGLPPYAKPNSYGLGS